MPTLPILPGPVLAGTVQAASPTPAGALPSDPTADPSGAGSFLDQLATALASLTPAEPAQPGPEAPQADDDEDAQTSDQAMVDLAASFGLVPLPLLTPLAPPQAVQPTTSDQANQTAVTGLSLLAQSPLLPLPQLLSSQMGTGAAVESTPAEAAWVAEPESQAAQAAPSDAATDPSTPTPSDAPAPAVLAAIHVPAEAPLGELRAAVATPAAEQLAGLSAQPPRPVETDDASRPGRQATVAASDPTAAAGAPALVVASHAPPVAERHAHDVREPAASIAALTASQLDQTVQHASVGTEAHGGHAEQRAATDGDAAPTTAADGAGSSSQTPPSFAATLAATASSPPAAAVEAHPREVVAQIAQQAELYRLPGGRGVRIQLRPEGLGGVEVTVRYGAAGALELHLNVEHAATGALVQSGWTELRDALSQQGISPDRLVMSVSGPQAGGLSSDAGGFGSGASFRSDAGTMGFGQSASQGQPDRQPAGGSAHPTPRVDAPPQQPEITAPAASSRIDLRA